MTPVLQTSAILALHQLYLSFLFIYWCSQALLSLCFVSEVRTQGKFCTAFHKCLVLCNYLFFYNVELFLPFGRFFCREMLLSAQTVLNTFNKKL